MVLVVVKVCKKHVTPTLIKKLRISVDEETYPIAWHHDDAGVMEVNIHYCIYIYIKVWF
jgi:hypothetical protein